jgi:hypothetical protein
MSTLTTVLGRIQIAGGCARCAASRHPRGLHGVAPSGVNGTATVYINGARHDDSYELETWIAALERAAAA